MSVKEQTASHRALRVSPWAVFYAAEEGAIVHNAYSWQKQTKLFTQDGSAITDLGRTGEVNGLAQSSIDALKRIGVLSSSHSGIAPLFEGVADNYRPLFDSIRLEIEVGNDLDSLTNELRGLSVAIALSNVGLRRIDLRIRPTATGAGTGTGIEPTLELKRAVEDFWESESLRKECTHWELLVDGNLLPSLLERNLADTLDTAGFELIVEDNTEVEPSAALESRARKCVEDLAREGYRVRVGIPSRCKKGLAERIRSWQQITDHSGVIVAPLATGTYRGIAVEPIDSPEDFAEAESVLKEVAETLGASLLRSEPWSSILLNSAVPGIARGKSSKEHAEAFLTSEAHWARSAAHAEAFLMAGTHELFPFLHFRSGLPAIANSSQREGKEDWPDCKSCPYGPLCDGYGTPAIDVLRRTGFEARAQRLAHMECQLRKHLLSAVLAEMYSNAQADYSGRTAAALPHMGPS